MRKMSFKTMGIEGLLFVMLTKEEKAEWMQVKIAGILSSE